MKEIKLKYKVNDRLRVVAFVEGCDKLLEQEQILDYLRLLEEREDLKTMSNPDDISQMKDLIERHERRCGLK